MRTLCSLASALLVGCGDPVPSDRDDTAASTDTDTGTDTDTDTQECRDQGESCTAYDDGGSNCCNGRHTCFPEGCYYTQP